MFCFTCFLSFTLPHQKVYIALSLYSPPLCLFSSLVTTRNRLFTWITTPPRQRCYLTTPINDTIYLDVSLSLHRLSHFHYFTDPISISLILF